MTLATYNLRYEAIMHDQHLSSNERSRKLAALMTDMERQYKIPSLRNEAWEKVNKRVIALYRKISLSRGW